MRTAFFGFASMTSRQRSTNTQYPLMARDVGLTPDPNGRCPHPLRKFPYSPLKHGAGFPAPSPRRERASLVKGVSERRSAFPMRPGIGKQTPRRVLRAKAIQPWRACGPADWTNSTPRNRKSGADGDGAWGDNPAALGHDLRRSVGEPNLVRVANHTGRPSAPFRTVRRELSKPGDLALGAGAVTGYRRGSCIGHRPSLPDRPAPEESLLVL